jgi:protease II
MSIKNLATGELLDDVLTETNGKLVHSLSVSFVSSYLFLSLTLFLSLVYSLLHPLPTRPYLSSTVSLSLSLSLSLGEIVWGADSSCLFYLKMDEQHSPNRLYLHVLGTKQEEDILYLTELDSGFVMDVEKTASDRFLIFGSESIETSELYVVDLQGVSG